MEFDAIDIDSDHELKERLSSWRRMPDVVKNRRDLGGEPGANETVIRLRQRNLGYMCMTSMQQHDGFYAQLEAFVQQEGRSPQHQQRVEDWAAFTLGVYEQSNALLLERGVQHELEDLPKEIIQTVYVSPPPPPRSWIQRALGI
jgi:hypothetical protein